MNKWIGAAAICINENNELLMVLQGKLDETKKWSVPSGGLKSGETLVQCCRREVEEETGYLVDVNGKLLVKYGQHEHTNIEVHYYNVSLIGGTKTIQDPDRLIYAIEWKSIEKIEQLELSFPEDKQFYLQQLKGKNS